MEIKKELLKQAKELRKKRKFAKVIHNRLISFDARQNPSEFDARMKNSKLLKSFCPNLLSNTILSFIVLRALKWLQRILSSISKKFLLIDSNSKMERFFRMIEIQT